MKPSRKIFIMQYSINMTIVKRDDHQLHDLNNYNKFKQNFNLFFLIKFSTRLVLFPFISTGVQVTNIH
jgi:hypothetical protein